ILKLEAWMVEDVERVATQLQAHRFADWNALKDRQVRIEELGPVEFVSGEVAELAGLRVAKAIGDHWRASQTVRTRPPLVCTDETRINQERADASSGE